MEHTEILTDNQKKILPMLAEFRSDFYLVGGTALALQIGHRRSIDFDLFTEKKIQRLKLKKTISEISPFTPEFSYESYDQLHLRIKDVKITFFQFPYKIPVSLEYKKIFKMPGLLTLAAMKAFAFAERAKWKDYVDIYFLLKYHFSLSTICRETEKLFNLNNSVVFTEKLFCQQLCYFGGIDYSEPVEYMTTSINNEEIKNFLIDVATQPF